MLSLDANDLLAKYVYKKGDIRANGSPRPGTLKPRDGEMLSMSEVTGLSHPDVCTHGHEHVDNPANSRVHIGYVKFIQSVLSHLGLETIYDNDPPRHVSVKFPDELEKRREIAKALSTKVLVLDIDSQKQYFAPC